MEMEFMFSAWDRGCRKLEEIAFGLRETLYEIEDVQRLLRRCEDPALQMTGQKLDSVTECLRKNCRTVKTINAAMEKIGDLYQSNEVSIEDNRPTGLAVESGLQIMPGFEGRTWYEQVKQTIRLKG